MTIFLDLRPSLMFVMNSPQSCIFYWLRQNITNLGGHGERRRNLLKL